MKSRKTSKRLARKHKKHAGRQKEQHNDTECVWDLWPHAAQFSYFHKQTKKCSLIHGHPSPLVRRTRWKSHGHLQKMKNLSLQKLHTKQMLMLAWVEHVFDESYIEAGGTREASMGDGATANTSVTAQLVNLMYFHRRDRSRRAEQNPHQRESTTQTNDELEWLCCGAMHFTCFPKRTNAGFTLVLDWLAARWLATCCQWLFVLSFLL